jgi:voltage-gated potassium channel
MFSQKIEWFIISLILLNVTAITLGTVQSIQAEYGTSLRGFELFCVLVFTVEYIARLYRAPSLPAYAGPRGRLRYAFSAYAIIDLLAIAPYFIALLIGAGSGTSLLRVLRVMSLFRLAKLLRYQKALQLIGGVMKSRAPELLVCSLLVFLFIFISGVILYALENEAQPEVFSSIPASLWWAVVTVTTIGYGDIIPVTAAGKIFNGLMAFIGIILIAIPTSIIVGGFMEATAKPDAERKPD